MTQRDSSRRVRSSIILIGLLTLLLCVVWGVGRAAAGAKTVLVLGTDISDTNSLDPQRQFVYSAPITEHAIYETLVTMTPGNYKDVKPLLATRWEAVDGGAGLVFHLRPNVKFVTGNPLTADDVKFTFERLKYLKDDASALAENIARVDVIDPLTVKVVLEDKTQPLLPFLIAPNFGIVDSKVVRQQGGLSTPDADKNDKATAYLDQRSVGTGPYTLTRWSRSTEIELVRNPGYWRQPAAFERVLIRHIPDSATQVLQLKRGDIDAALNLTFDQLTSLRGTSGIGIVKGQSLDFMYIALTSASALSQPLSNKLARQALMYAIDYDGIIKGLIGGDAIRPASFIPIGLGGSTADLTREVGYRQDLDKARALLAQTGVPNGFAFDLSYGSGADVGGVSYEVVAQKVQADLARVKIQANLKPMEQGNLRTAYRKGDLAATITFWNPDAMDPSLWADPTVQRVAKRVRWDPDASALALAKQASGEPNPQKRDALYVQFQKLLIDQANLCVLFQPVYSHAIRDSITGYQLTAAGWQVDLYDIKPR
ncbi:MAG TPA: ABC transporter substrate-binding protein [Candidatus Methylomirabilis sp.]|nr:ABC transporter substrate-binding protein [Candidatus Methylomirabilis sp.]